VGKTGANSWGERRHGEILSPGHIFQKIATWREGVTKGGEAFGETGVQHFKKKKSRRGALQGLRESGKNKGNANIRSRALGGEEICQKKRGRKRIGRRRPQGEERGGVEDVK